MARKHSWGKDLGSDTVQIGKIAARGIEQPYHDRLFGYLQGKYGKAVSMEVTRGRSRPDIVVWDTVAIEVKGPTGSGELNTVASKIIRYKQHFKQFVCVLFDIEDPVHFKEWLRGIEQNHPEVIVIPK